MKTSMLPLVLAIALASPLAMAEPAPASTDKAAATQAADGWNHGNHHRGQAMKRGPKAGGQRMMHNAPRESFSEETVRKSADGKTTRHKIEQKVTDKGFTRKESMTNAEGKTATRNVSASYDKDKETWSHKMEGKDFDGKEWSRSQEGKGKAAGWQRGKKAAAESKAADAVKAK